MRFSYVAVFALTLSTACASSKQALREPSDPSDGDLRRAALHAAAAEMMNNFQRVHFEFDSALITDDTREALAANVQIMRRYPELQLEVEGHCDELGATEYNLALGQRRADAIRKYMVTAGVAPSHVSTISFGEERPLVDGEDAFAENRRAEFQVTFDPFGVAASSDLAANETETSSRLAQR
ncbi:MAG: OmpA family protein [Deltaproteobacteria bacterium]|nr:OmpA family protein [Deltaproteobacteria bacterium]